MVLRATLSRPEFSTATLDQPWCGLQMGRRCPHRAVFCATFLQPAEDSQLYTSGGSGARTVASIQTPDKPVSRLKELNALDARHTDREQRWSVWTP